MTMRKLILGFEAVTTTKVISYSSLYVNIITEIVFKCHSVTQLYPELFIN